MHHVREEDLPLIGSSYNFVGADQGDTGVSVYLLNAVPGKGPGPHRLRTTRSSSGDQGEGAGP